MDFYCYYKERLSWGPNPYSSVAQCQRIVAEMLDNPVIPPRIAAESAVGFLSALTDFAGDGCSTIRVYDTIMDSTIEAMQRMRDTVNDAEQAWLLETLEAECTDGRGPMYDPSDYVVQDADLDEDDLPEEPEPDEPDLEALEALYGVCGEAGVTGTRRPFPDWQHIDSWTQADWTKLQIYKDKVLAPAGQSFDYMRPAIDTLAAIEFHTHRLPLPRQVELSMLAVEIVDGLMDGLETNLQTLCAGSLHTHQGRRIQKEMRYPNENELNQIRE